MSILIYLIIFLAVGLLAVGIFGLPQYRRVKLPPAPEERPALKKIKLSSRLLDIFPFTRKLLVKLKWDAKLKDKLDTAHLKLTPQEFFNLKLILIVLLGGLGLFISTKSIPAVLVLAVVLGYFIPEILVYKRISQRKYAIARLLPEIVDLLGLCVEAGLDFTTAMKWVIEKVSANPLLEELSFVLEEIKWGKSRTQALKDMAKRLSIPEVSSFVQTLVQAERMGTPVAEAFMILSEDTRLQRFHRGERIAMQAPIKILIPLIFCILPVIVITVGGPTFLKFMQGNLFQGFGR